MSRPDRTDEPRPETERRPKVDRSDELRDAHVERQIREAMDRGEFDDLPGAGKPIPGLDRPHEPGWWARRWLERERLADRVRDVAAWAARMEVRVVTMPDDAEARRLADEIVARVSAINHHLPAGDRIRQRTVDELLERRASRPDPDGFWL